MTPRKIHCSGTARVCAYPMRKKKEVGRHPAEHAPTTMVVVDKEIADVVD
jgi:hypothetical protein